MSVVLSDYARRTRRTSSGHQVPQNLWVNSLAKLPNITSYTFCHIPFFSFPQSQNRFLPIPHEQIELTVAALANCSLLDELNLLYRATPSDISRLNRLENVHTIRLGLPSREVLVAVRPWIEQCDSFSVRVGRNRFCAAFISYTHLGCLRLGFFGYDTASRLKPFNAPYRSSSCP